MSKIYRLCFVVFICATYSCGSLQRKPRNNVGHQKQFSTKPIVHKLLVSTSTPPPVTPTSFNILNFDAYLYKPVEVDYKKIFAKQRSNYKVNEQSDESQESNEDLTQEVTSQENLNVNGILPNENSQTNSVNESKVYHEKANVPVGFAFFESLRTKMGPTYEALYAPLSLQSIRHTAKAEPHPVSKVEKQPLHTKFIELPNQSTRKYPGQPLQEQKYVLKQVYLSKQPIKQIYIKPLHKFQLPLAYAEKHEPSKQSGKGRQVKQLRPEHQERNSYSNKYQIENNKQQHQNEPKEKHPNSGLKPANNYPEKYETPTDKFHQEYQFKQPNLELKPVNHLPEKYQITKENARQHSTNPSQQKIPNLRQLTKNYYPLKYESSDEKPREATKNYYPAKYQSSDERPRQTTSSHNSPKYDSLDGNSRHGTKSFNPAKYESSNDKSKQSTKNYNPDKYESLDDTSKQQHSYQTPQDNKHTNLGGLGQQASNHYPAKYEKPSGNNRQQISHQTPNVPEENDSNSEHPSANHYSENVETTQHLESDKLNPPFRPSQLLSVKRIESLPQLFNTQVQHPSEKVFKIIVPTSIDYERISQRQRSKRSHNVERVEENFWNQDIYTAQLKPHLHEFGHTLETPNGWEERFEKNDLKKRRFQGKIKWEDNHGYGEHYWDLNH